MNKKIKIGTVFSGIGAPEQALNKLGIPFEIIFACDTGEIYLKETKEELEAKMVGLSEQEKNEFIKKLYHDTKKHNFVKDSYFENYDISEDRWFPDIRFLDGKKFKNKLDILVGGSPCQSFSIIGKRAGLEDTRGTLFFEFARLINETKPKVFIYENVPGMLIHDKGKTWEVIQQVFDSLGYTIFHSILNSKDYGIPQNRKRLFVVGFKKQSVDFEFPKSIPLTTTIFNYLEENNKVKHTHYLGKKGFEFVTSPLYKNRARVNSEIIQTQKANQQFNWNGDFVFVPFDEIKSNKAIMARAYISNWNGQKGAIRQLSHRECLRLMGFPDTFKIVVPNVHAYRQAGNSIVVNVLEKIFEEIFKVEKF